MGLKEVVTDHPEMFHSGNKIHTFEVLPDGSHRALVKLIVHPEYPSRKDIARNPGLDPDEWKGFIQLCLVLKEVPDEGNRITCDLLLEKVVRGAGVEKSGGIGGLYSEDFDRVYRNVAVGLWLEEVPADAYLEARVPAIRQMVDLTLRARAMIPEYEDGPSRSDGVSP